MLHLIKPYHLLQFGVFYILASFPLTYQFSNIGIIILILGWIWALAKKDEHVGFQNISKPQKLIFASFIGFFVWNLISLLYAENVSYGWKNIESKLSFLIFPLILFSTRLDRKTILNSLRIYFYSILLCTIVLLSRSILNYLNQGELLTYHDFVGLLDFHAVFYSYYTFLAILFGLYLLEKQVFKKTEKSLFILFILIFFIGLVFAASKNVLVVSALTFGLYWTRVILKGKLSKKIMLAGSVIALFAVLLILRIPSVENRISELKSLQGIEAIEMVKSGELLQHEDRVKLNGTSVRLLFWYIGLEQLSEHQRWLIGLNPADRRDVINERFYEVGLNPWFENYNLHNQFIQILVELGIIGLLIYLLIHLFLFREAIKSKNWLLVTFLSAFVIFQITESVLERNKGIVFVIFFLLFLQQLNQLKHESWHIGDKGNT